MNEKEAMPVSVAVPTINNSSGASYSAESTATSTCQKKHLADNDKFALADDTSKQNK